MITYVITLTNTQIRQYEDDRNRTFILATFLAIDKSHVNRVFESLTKAERMMDDNCEVVRKLGSISQHLDKLHEFNNSDQMKLLFASLHVNWPEAGLGHLVAFNLEEIPLWPYVKPLEVL